MKLYTKSDLSLILKGKNKGMISPHQKVKLKCDECENNFERLYGSGCDDTDIHYCKSCTTARYNKSRDPEVNKKFRQARIDSQKGKTFEEQYGKEKADLIKAKFSAAYSGKNNPNYGGKYSRGFADRPIFGPIEDRYSPKIVEKLKHIRSQNGKLSFGRPAPKGSGSGFSGWYKEKYYFRSLLELFCILDLEARNINFICCESIKMKFQYNLDGEDKNYFPDFYLPDTDELLECKAKWNMNTKETKAKIQSVDKKITILTEEDINVDIEKLILLIDNEDVKIDKSKIEKLKRKLKL